MVAVQTFIVSLYDSVAPVWVELTFLLFFALGFSLLKADVIARFFPALAPIRKKSFSSDPVVERTFDPKLAKTIEAAAAVNNAAGVLTAWRARKVTSPTPLEILKLVAQAVLDEAPSVTGATSGIEEIAESIGVRGAHAQRAAVVVLDVVARSSKASAMLGDVRRLLERQLYLRPSAAVYEVLLGGFASVADEQAVNEVLAEMRQSGVKLTARAHAVTIKGFLKNSMVDAILQRILEMLKDGFYVPPFAVMQFVRIACEAGRAEEVFSNIKRIKLVMPCEAVAHLLECCTKRADMDLAVAVESFSRATEVPFSASSYDSLLKLYASAGDLRALSVFEEMQSSSHRVSEGLCVALLARSAESKFLRFAEEVVRYLRNQDRPMTIAMYSALMKVYAYSNMYDKACDLYDQLCEDGLEPDAVMYGCLMKFSVECGRTDLSRRLSEKCTTLDIQNYMSLIRAAGRDRDVDRAFQVLAKLRESGVELDVAAHNCVLDVCASCGDMRRARSHFEEMRRLYSVDVITYNTLLKGYCARKDLHGARALLEEMRKDGVQPNDVSYNSLINSAVSSGSYDSSWEIIEQMEGAGVPVDIFTISIMMKAVKKMHNPSCVARTLALLDKSRLNVYSDEILLNTVLETCVRHREFHRLEIIIDAYAKSGLRPSPHTYGSLIKACGVLKRLDKCWELWREMTRDRGMDPNDIVLGCMLDALVCNRMVEEAMSLWVELKPKMVPNSIIYSTLIKGFASAHQSGRAMDLWREMRDVGVQMNTVVYNAVIDAQARAGLMKEVNELVRSMDADGCVPDAITYSTIVKGYCVSGDLDAAFEVFKNMQNNSMARDSIVYNTVLDGCTRHSRYDLADELLADMARFNIVPSNFTLGILVKMWGRRKQLRKAFEVFEEIPKRHGVVPNALVRTSLVTACLHNNSLDGALQVFDDLRASSQGADSRIFGSLISSCVRQGQTRRAVALVEDAYGLKAASRRGLPPNQTLDDEVMEALLRALVRAGLMHEVAMPLIDKLRAAKSPVSGRILSSMVGSSGAEALRRG